MVLYDALREKATGIPGIHRREADVSLEVVHLKAIQFLSLETGDGGDVSERVGAPAEASQGAYQTLSVSFQVVLDGLVETLGPEHFHLSERLKSGLEGSTIEGVVQKVTPLSAPEAAVEDGAQAYCLQAELFLPENLEPGTPSSFFLLVGLDGVHRMETGQILADTSLGGGSLFELRPGSSESSGSFWELAAVSLPDPSYQKPVAQLFEAGTVEALPLFASIHPSYDDYDFVPPRPTADELEVFGPFGPYAALGAAPGATLGEPAETPEGFVRNAFGEEAPLALSSLAALPLDVPALAVEGGSDGQGAPPSAAESARSDDGLSTETTGTVEALLEEESGAVGSNIDPDAGTFLDFIDQLVDKSFG